MITTTELSRLELLVLARLSAKLKSQSVGEIATALLPMLAEGTTKSVCRERVDAALAALAGAGLVEGSSRLVLTEPGWRRAREALGIQRPERWQMIKNGPLVALALGLDWNDAKVRARLKSADALRATVLAESLGVDAGPAPTLSKVIDALCWRELGLDRGQPLSRSINFLRSSLLARAHDMQPMKAEKMAEVLAARSAGARNRTADGVRAALTRRWLDSARAASAGAGGGAEAEPDRPAGDREAEQEGAAEVPDLRELAARVQREADAVDASGRFGDRKVFISAIWRRLAAEPRFATLGEQAFKQQLVEANREGLLSLHRADLVGAMDPAEVERSEARYMNATFHFVESQPGPRF